MKKRVAWWQVLLATFFLGGVVSLLWIKQSQSSYLPPVPAGIGLDYSKLSEEQKQILKEREEKDQALAKEIQRRNQ